MPGCRSSSLSTPSRKLAVLKAGRGSHPGFSSSAKISVTVGTPAHAAGAAIDLTGCAVAWRARTQNLVIPTTPEAPGKALTIGVNCSLSGAVVFSDDEQEQPHGYGIEKLTKQFRPLVKVIRFGLHFCRFYTFAMPKLRFPSKIVPRALVICGRRTTLRLEPDLWAALDEMAVRERAPSLSRLVSGIVEDGQGSMGSATSAVRAAIVRYYRAAADEAAANGAAPAARPALSTPLAKSTYG